jgi:hypothetical protein
MGNPDDLNIIQFLLLDFTGNNAYQKIVWLYQLGKIPPESPSECYNLSLLKENFVSSSPGAGIA